MKKLKILALGLVSSFALTGCGQKGIKINPDKKRYKVGICQLVQHPALDAATKGFKAQLEEDLNAKGRKVRFIEKNASGENSLCASISSGFVSKRVDLIMANATPALQAAVNATANIPVLGTSVTDYQTALTDIQFNEGKSGTNVSGTSDYLSIADQIDLMVNLVDSLTDKTRSKYAVLYCSAEANSKLQADEAVTALQSHGKSATHVTFSETTELIGVCASIVANYDAVFVPTDNTVAKSTTTIKANISDKKVPVFAGESGICEGCGFATLSIDYERLGRITGEMAAQILTGEKDIREYPVRYDTTPTKMFNEEIATSLGFDIAQLVADGFEKI